MSESKPVDEFWLGYFKKSEGRRNFPVIVESVKLFVNKYMLAGCSAFFENALFGESKETNQDHLDLPGKSLSEIVDLFLCVLSTPPHAGRLEITIDNFDTVYPLAEEYIIEELFASCVEFLDDNLIGKDKMSDEKVLKWLEKRGFVTIFAYDRFEKFRCIVVELLKQMNNQVYLAYIDIIPTESLVDIVTEREKELMTTCDSRVCAMKLQLRKEKLSSGRICFVKSQYETWLQYFKLKADQRDFALAIEGTDLFVNKFLLAGTSDFFKAALFGEMNGASIENYLDLPNKSLEEMVQLLSCAMIYLPGRQRCQISVDNFATVFRLADEFIIEEFLERCIKFLEFRTSMVTIEETEILRWFEVDLVAAIFTYERLAKFREKAIDYLIFTSLDFWKDFVNVISKENFRRIIIGKENDCRTFCRICKKLLVPED